MNSQTQNAPAVVSNNAQTKLAKISLYTDRGQKTGIEITIEDFIDGIRNGTDWKEQTEDVRSVDKQTDKEEYDLRKAKAACVTASGTYEGDKSEKGLREYSGFMAIDCDGLENVEITRNQLNADPYTYACFTSIGGKGLCIMVKIQPERFADAFLALEDYYLSTYGLIIDKQCKNINRLRYVSHDPAIIVNEDSGRWKKYLPAKERKKRENPVGEYVDTDHDFNHVLEQIESRQLDIVPGYDEWHRVGFALVSKYGESGREYFHRVSRNGGTYDQAQCDKLYSYLLRFGARQITIATFYYFAKIAGAEVMSPQTRLIVGVATGGKRNKIALASTVDTVVKMLDIPAAECRPVIEQVYAAHADIETEQSIYEQAITYLKVQEGLFYNEVSRRIEKPDGTIIEGKRQINTLYNVLLISLDGKLKRSDFDSLLFSDNVRDVNPIHQFFAKHKDRKPVGAIAKLAATIETDTGFEGHGEFCPTYAEHFLRKWLISLVAKAFGELSDLMLILTGPQGSGKTEFFRRLLPPELSRYYDETKLDKGKDDEILMCEKWVVMLDELSGKAYQDVATIKALLSKRSFSLREPYGSSNVTLQRRAVLCGTSNPKAVLFDDTGNRRIIPINVLKIDRDGYNSVNKIDLLIEAYHAWKAGETYQLNAEDIRLLNQNTTGFEKWSIERELLERFYAKPTGAGAEVTETIQAVDIQIYLEQRGNNRKLSPENIKSALNAMGIETYQKRMGKDPATGKARRPYVYDIVKVSD